MKLLIAFDGSAPAQQAIRMVAGWQGERAQVASVLLNVQVPPLKLSPEVGIDHSILESALREEGRARLEPAATLLRSTGLEPEVVVRLGHAAETIAEVARDLNVAGIVMGTRGHGALSGFPLGSVALRVVQGCDVPVALVKADARLPFALGRRLKVVAPVDGSDAARQAVLRLAAVKDLLGELHVDLLHVRQPLTYLEALMPPHEDIVQRWSGAQADVVLADASQLLLDAGVGHEAHALADDPATGIAEFAQVRDADLIVMSASGIGTLRHLVIGSVALKAAHLSHVPVVFVPSPR